MNHHHALSFLLALTLTACGGGEQPTAPTGPEIGLVYDAGGRGDKSFNDAAYRGLTRAKDELGVAVKDIEPSAQTSKEAAMRALAQRGTPVIFGIGVLFSAEITKLAEEFPKTRFVCIDYAPPAGYGEGGKPLPANLLGVRFREHEGGYLVGAIAAQVTKTKTIGFVGGQKIPLLERFVAGYRAGAQAIDPDVKVLIDYAGNTPAAWTNPTKGKELALAQYGGGADVILHGAGSTGLGVFAAAKETGKLAIGVDSDQSDEAPEHIVTSMLKRVDEAVFRAIVDYKAGKPQSGIQSLGLAEQGLGYVAKEQNARWITPEVKARVDALRDQIVAGEIVVPTR